MGPLAPTIVATTGPGGSRGFGVYLVALGVVALVAGWVAARRDGASPGWPTVVGTVRRSWIDDDDGESVEVEVAYRVQGREHVVRHTAVDAMSLAATRRDVLRRLRPGTPIVVHHHPRRPHVTRLRTGLRWQSVIAPAVGLVMLAAGAAMAAGWAGSAG